MRLVEPSLQCWSVFHAWLTTPCIGRYDTYVNQTDFKSRSEAWNLLLQAAFISFEDYASILPEIVWTWEERAAWEEMINSLNSQTHRIDITELVLPRQTGDRLNLPPSLMATLNFSLHLLNRRSELGYFEMPIAILLGMRAWSPSGWLQPYEFTSIISSIIKISRMFVIIKCLTRCTMADSMLFDNFQAVRNTPIDICEQLTTRLLQRGPHRGIEYLLSLRAYGMKIAQDVQIEGGIIWFHPDILHYRGLEFSMGQFREMIAALIQSTTKTLTSILQNRKPPAIPWHQIREEINRKDAYYNFLKAAPGSIADSR